MTVSSETSRMKYIGNGATSIYAYNFKIFDESELLVTRRNLSDVETTLVLNTDYTVSGVGVAGGGNITLTAGNLTSGFILTIRRVRELKQETVFRNQSEFYPELHETAFDKLVMIDQQQQDEINRSLKLAETIDPAGFDPTLPSDLPALSFLQVNDDGDGFTAGPFPNINNEVGTLTASRALQSDGSGQVEASAITATELSYLDNATSNIQTQIDTLSSSKRSFLLSIHEVTSADYTVLNTDGYDVIDFSTGASNRTCTLPTAAAANDGRRIRIRKTDSGTGSVTVTDGTYSFTLYTQNMWLDVVSNGSAWSTWDEGVETITVDATGSGDLTGGVFRFTKNRRNRMISVVTGITWSSAATAISANTLIPVWMRPPTVSQNVYTMSATLVYRVQVETDGRISFVTRDWTGTGTVSTGAGGAVGTIVSYDVA